MKLNRRGGTVTNVLFDFHHNWNNVWILLNWTNTGIEQLLNKGMKLWNRQSYTFEVKSWTEHFLKEFARNETHIYQIRSPHLYYIQIIKNKKCKSEGGSCSHFSIFGYFKGSVNIITLRHKFVAGDAAHLRFWYENRTKCIPEKNKVDVTLPEMEAYNKHCLCSAGTQMRRNV